MSAADTRVPVATIISPAQLAALEAAGYVVVEREWLEELESYASVQQCEYDVTGRFYCCDTVPTLRRSPCRTCRARWRIAERERGRGR